jgi:DNA-binding CsgD family transcriptional regulator
MSLVLSEAEARNLVRAVTVLASPMDYPSVDAWRAAVNLECCALLGADSAGFMLPLPGRRFIYSAEHDPAALARFPELPLPSLDDGRNPMEHVLERGACTLAETYQGDPARYLRSAHYNDLAAPNHAHDTLTGIAVVPGADGAAAGLLFWHERPNGRTFRERERALLNLLLPGLKAGSATALRLGSRRDFIAAIDALNQAVLVYTADGRVLHRTARLEQELAADPEASRISGELVATASALLGGNPADVARVGSSVTTRRADYAVFATLLARSGPLGEPLALVCLERRSPIVREPEDLRRSFGLTPAETRVAVLLAEGCSNSAIAGALFISPATARRHTEKILEKVGVASRAGLPARLLC